MYEKEVTRPGLLMRPVASHRAETWVDDVLDSCADITPVWESMTCCVIQDSTAKQLSGHYTTPIVAAAADDDWVLPPSLKVYDKADGCKCALVLEKADSSMLMEQECCSLRVQVPIPIHNRPARYRKLDPVASKYRDSHNPF